MTIRTLCDVGLKVQMSGNGGHAALFVVDGVTVRFDCHTQLLRAVLEGAPLQVSAKQGFCLIERRGGSMRLEFGISGAGRQVCDFPVEDFIGALEEIEG